MAMLEGRRILVTGGSRGIGAAIVRVVHREGAEIALHYGSSASAARSIAEELGARVHLVKGDLMEPSAVGGVWDDALAALGHVDVLVNNAGAWLPSPLEPIEQWTDGWRENLQLNLQAPADLSRRAIEHFGTRGGGIIVSITSRSAHRGDDADHLAYGAAKGGLLALTRGIARGYGHHGVLAYAVAPGWVATDIAEGLDLKAAAQSLPLREITPPSDVAEMVAFLASGRSRHATGTTIDISGADYVR